MPERDQAGGAEAGPGMGLSPRLARLSALAAGGAAGAAVLFFGSGAPWWMAPFTFLVVGVVTLRLLRPTPRVASWADEA